MSFRIMLAGGGTGGHVYPLVAIAQELVRLSRSFHREVQIRFIGSGYVLASEAKQLGIPCRKIFAPKFRRYTSAQNILDIFKIPLAILQSFFFVWSFMPDVMLVKGGYGAFFPALAARLMFIPL